MSRCEGRVHDRCPEGHAYRLRGGRRVCPTCIYRSRQTRRRKVAFKAVRNGLRWESWEVALVLERRHSVPETALMIGRTMVAVENFRRRTERRAS